MSTEPGASFGLSAKQLSSVADSRGRVNLWEGSVRSGKTIGSLVRWFLFVSTARKLSGELVMVGRTRDAVWRNVIAPMQDPKIFGQYARHVEGNHGAPQVTIFGRRIHVLGASDSKSEKVIRGMTVVGAYGDEVTTWPVELFKQLLARMSPPQARMFGTTNPDSPAHWLKREFLDRVDALPWRVFHFTMDDNPSLTKEYVDSLKAEYSGLWYRRFILGEWVSADGAVYDMWDKNRHVIPWADMPAMVRIFGLGLDYGTTNPTAGLLLGQDAEGILYLMDEWRYDPATAQGQRLTDQEISRRLLKWLGEVQHAPRNLNFCPYIFLDPAAASLRVQLHQDGAAGQLASADNSVLYGIRTISSLLATNRLRVSDRCKGFLSEVDGYSWDADETKKGEDKPVKSADHSLDAARYIVATSESLWRPHLPPVLDSEESS